MYGEKVLTLSPFFSGQKNYAEIYIVLFTRVCSLLSVFGKASRWMVWQKEIPPGHLPGLQPVPNFIVPWVWKGW